jgi:AcrR family transcriptional regulator
MKPGAPTKGEQSRAKILSKSIKLLAKHGMAETSFQLIADACGLSQSAVLYHFKNKNLLIEACLESIAINNFTIVSSKLNPKDTALERLEKHFHGNLEWADNYGAEAQLILLIYYLASFNARFAKIYSTILGRARTRIAEILLAAQREKQISATTDVELCSQILHDALLGSLVNTISVPASARNHNELKKKWRLLIAKLLH